MQDRIHQSLKPAVRHVFLVLVQRWPQALALLDHFDEVFAVLSLFLERHYLAKNDALLAESLYGFKRSRYHPQGQTPQQQRQQNASTGMYSSQNTGISSGTMSPLTQMDRRKALLVNILAPYAKAKLDALYTHWKDVLPPLLPLLRRHATVTMGEGDKDLQQTERKVRTRTRKRRSHPFPPKNPSLSASVVHSSPCTLSSTHPTKAPSSSTNGPICLVAPNTTPPSSTSSASSSAGSPTKTSPPPPRLHPPLSKAPSPPNPPWPPVLPAPLKSPLLSRLLPSRSLNGGSQPQSSFTPPLVQNASFPPFPTPPPPLPLGYPCPKTRVSALCVRM